MPLLHEKNVSYCVLVNFNTTLNRRIHRFNDIQEFAFNAVFSQLIYKSFQTATHYQKLFRSQ